MASIKNRNGHYLVTVSKGYDVYGKKLIETRTFTPDPTRTKKQQEQDLRRFVLAFEDEVRNGIAQDARKTTFKEFAERWMTEYATVHLQARTVVKYTEELEEKIQLMEEKQHENISGHRASQARRHKAGNTERLFRGYDAGRGAKRRKSRGLLQNDDYENPKRRIISSAYSR